MAGKTASAKHNVRTSIEAVPTKTQMKKPIINSEQECPECKGTGFAAVKQPPRSPDLCTHVQ
jgi:hypothetical protein